MAKQDPMIEKAVEILKAASLNPEIRMLHDAREKALKDINSIRGDGYREGEVSKAKAMARNLLKEGVEVSIISRASGLSREEVMELKDEMNN